MHESYDGKKRHGNERGADEGFQRICPRIVEWGVSKQSFPPEINK